MAQSWSHAAGRGLPSVLASWDSIHMRNTVLQVRANEGLLSLLREQILRSILLTFEIFKLTDFDFILTYNTINNFK